MCTSLIEYNPANTQEYTNRILSCHKTKNPLPGSVTLDWMRIICILKSSDLTTYYKVCQAYCVNHMHDYTGSM